MYVLEVSCRDFCFGFCVLCRRRVVSRVVSWKTRDPNYYTSISSVLSQKQNLVGDTKRYVRNEAGSVSYPIPLR